MHSSQKAVASNQLTEVLLAGKKTSVLLVERYGTAAGKAQEDFPAKIIALIAHGGVICRRQRKSLLLFLAFVEVKAGKRSAKKQLWLKNNFYLTFQTFHLERQRLRGWWQVSVQSKYKFSSLDTDSKAQPWPHGRRASVMYGCGIHA